MITKNLDRFRILISQSLKSNGKKEESNSRFGEFEREEKVSYFDGSAPSAKSNVEKEKVLAKRPARTVSVETVRNSWFTEGLIFSITKNAHVH